MLLGTEHMHELFSVILSQAMSWIGSRLEHARCTRCDAPQEKTITNVTFNLFSCPHCGNHLAQFVNATPHTINRDKTVACAGISDVHYHLLSADAFQLCNTLNTVNVTDQPVVVEGRLRVPYQPPFFTCRTDLIKPTVSLRRWKNEWTIPFRAVPLRDFPIGVDLVVYNPWQERLAVHRGHINSVDLFLELIRLDLKILELDHRRLVLEFERLEREQRQQEQRYRELVLQLAEYALHDRVD